MAKVKGSAISSRINYLKTKCTAEQQQRILAELEPALRGIVDTGAFASQWYPLQYLIDFSLAIDTVAGRGDKALIPTLGVFSAQEALKGIYKIFFKFGSPEFIITRASQVWSRYYDSGRLTVESEGKGRVSVILSDFDTPSHDHCLSVQGWIQGMLELSGAKSVRVTNPQCRKQGGRVCGFEAVWE